VRGQDLARVEGDDGDLALVDDGEDAPTGMSGSDPEVMQSTRPAQGDPAAAIDQVVAEPEPARDRPGASWVSPGRPR
jgi:hypothetical protein